MNLDVAGLPAAALIGFGATVVVDIWTLLLKRAFKIPSLSYCLVGRWLRHMPAGKFTHASIVAAPQKPLECPVGWIAHYIIGVVFATCVSCRSPRMTG